jgi:hypothetical protein
VPAVAGDRDSLAALWGREKTQRLLATGALSAYYTGADGRRFFAESDVLRHYAFKSADTPHQGMLRLLRAL